MRPCLSGWTQVAWIACPQLPSWPAPHNSVTMRYCTRRVPIQVTGTSLSCSAGAQYTQMILTLLFFRTDPRISILQIIFGHVSMNSRHFLDAYLLIIPRAFSDGLLIHCTSNLMRKLVIGLPGMMGLTSIGKLLLVALNPSSYLSPLCLHPHTTHSPAGNVHSQMSCYIWSNILFSCQIWWKIMMYILFLKDIQHIEALWCIHTSVD